MNEIDEEYMQERARYYSDVAVKFELCKALYHRELSILSSKLVPKERRKKAVRYLVAFKVDFLDRHFQWFNFLKSPLNLYCSVATLKDIPILSYNIRKRLEDKNYIRFNENYQDFVTGYNFWCDFDGHEDINKCYSEVRAFKKILDEFQCPYYLLNSSPTGFHFNIEAKYLLGNPLDNIKKINAVVYNIAKLYDFDCLDIGVIDLKRLRKLEYSEAEGVICLPLSDEQFSNWNLKMVKPDNVLKNIQIRNRGNLIRMWGLSLEQLQTNTSKFLKEFV